MEKIQWLKKVKTLGGYGGQGSISTNFDDVLEFVQDHYRTSLDDTFLGMDLIGGCTLDPTMSIRFLNKTLKLNVGDFLIFENNEFRTGDQNV